MFPPSVDPRAMMKLIGLQPFEFSSSLDDAPCRRLMAGKGVADTKAESTSTVESESFIFNATSSPTMSFILCFPTVPRIISVC